MLLNRIRWLAKANKESEQWTEMSEKNDNIVSSATRRYKNQHKYEHIYTLNNTTTKSSTQIITIININVHHHYHNQQHYS